MSYHIMGHPVRRSGGRPALALGAITLGGLGIGGFGGGGLGRGLVHLFIWRLIWRGGLAIWRVPIFGPAIDIVLALAIVALLVLRSQLGPGWWQRLGRGPRGGGSSGGAPGGGAPGGGAPGGEPRGW